MTQDARDANAAFRSQNAQPWHEFDPHAILMRAVGAAVNDADAQHAVTRGDDWVPDDYDHHIMTADRVVAACAQQAAAALQDLDDLAERQDAEAAKAALAHKKECRQLDALWKLLSNKMGPVIRDREKYAPDPSKIYPTGKSLALAKTDAEVKSVEDAISRIPPFALPTPPPRESAVGMQRLTANDVLRNMLTREGERPTDDQVAALKILADYVDGHITEAPLIFLHGAGGTGKSFVTKCFDEILAVVGKHVVPSALTGVACASISCRDAARTLHSTLHLNAETLRPVTKLTPADREFMNARFANCGALTIDEISFTGAQIFDSVNERLRDIPNLNRNLDFGGLPVIVSGDLHQLPGVMIDPLYKDLLATSADFDATNKKHQAKMNGLRLFKKFRLVSLFQQMRCRDGRHQCILDNLRIGVTAGLKRYIWEHRLKDSDFLNDPKWKSAGIIFKHNAAKNKVNALMARRLATETQRKLVTWRLDFEGAPPRKKYKKKHKGSPDDNAPRKRRPGMKLDRIRALHGQVFVESLYEHSPGLTYSFVPGAPCILLSNPNTARGLANGIPAEMHSLTFAERDQDDAAVLLGADGDHIKLPDNCRPTHVNVRLIGPRDTSRDNNASDEEKAAFNDWVQSYADITLVKGDVVVPIPTERSDKDEIAHAAGGAKMPVFVFRPSVDLAIALTVHKSQGATRDRVIVHLDSLDSYQSTFVAMSRVRVGDNERFLFNDEDDEEEFNEIMKKIEKLTPPPE